MRMTSMVGLVLTSALLVPNPALEAQDQSGAQVLSPQLFDAIEAWSDGDATLEDVALETNPDAIIDYAQRLTASLGGRPLATSIGTAFPDVLEEYLRIEGDQEDDQEFFGYFLVNHHDEYQRFQNAPRLVQAGMTFANHVSERYPDLISARDEANITPADRGTSLVTFLEEEARSPALALEANKVLTRIGAGRTDPCVCWLSVSNEILPFDTSIFEPEGVPYNAVKDRGWKKHTYEYRARRRGPATWVHHRRKTVRKGGESNRPMDSGYNEQRVRMLCTKNGVPGGQQCDQVNACSARLDLMASYAVEMGESVASSDPIASHMARAHVFDAVEFLHEPPGAAPAISLFEKGASIFGNTKDTVNIQPLVQALSAGAQIASNIIGGTTSQIESSMVNDLLTGLVGIVTHEDSGNNEHLTMRARFDSTDNAPFQILPHHTYKFKMQNHWATLSDGYGNKSEAVMSIRSNYLITGVLGNIHCAAGVSGPPPLTFWYYDGETGSPDGFPAMQQAAEAFLATEFGMIPPNVNQSNGTYP